MMAMFEITGISSDASDRPIQSTEQVDCNDIADVAVAELNDHVSVSSIEQPMEDRAQPLWEKECN
eukprot:2312815-Pyramimonas_sp.AAC.1